MVWFLNPHRRKSDSNTQLPKANPALQVMPSSVTHVATVLENLSKLQHDDSDDGVVFMETVIFYHEANPSGCPVAEEDFGAGVEDGGRVVLFDAGAELALAVHENLQKKITFLELSGET